MKRNLLVIASLLFTGLASSQFTLNNAPEVGDGIYLYVVDSSATNMETTVGNGVTWDYSGLADYNAERRLIDVKNPLNTVYAVDFPNSQKAIDMEGELVTFVNDDANGRVSQGVVYKDDINGELVLSLESNSGVYYTYPFDLGDSNVDDLTGTANYTTQGQTLTVPASGKVYTTVDGKGTLKLGLTGVYNNVIRYKIVDTIRLDTPLGEYTSIHKQFEYYDFTVSNLPIFVHSYLKFGPTNGVPRNEFTFVLSKDIKTTSIVEEKLNETKMYPNPSSGLVKFEISSDIKTAEVSVLDALGRVMFNSELDQNSKGVDLSHLKKGSYFVKISLENTTITKSLILN